ncbi:MAG: 6-pyruvoyl-tetrahydropterin synthase-related protein [bacterium]|nr:6-pyruvoyl-tetrahydropterin synthase-related protein [bacterium]
MKFKLIILCVLLSMSTLAVFPMFNSPFLHLMHDQIQAERVFEMARAVSYGQFPVRFVQDLGYGYGYPLFNYYAPFPYYFGVFVLFFVSDLILATKLMIVFGFAAASYAMYTLGARLWGPSGGILSSMLYLLAPYHAVQLYVRGSIGELYSYAVLPFIVLGIYELWNSKPKTRYIALGTLSLAVMISSHTLSLIMFFFLFGLYMIFVFTYALRKRDVKLIYRNIIFVTISLCMSAFYWIPAVTELNQIQLSTSTGNDVDFRTHFKNLTQLWTSPWGYGGSASTPDKDGMSFMIGKISILIASITILLSLYNLLIKKVKLTSKYKLIFVISVLFIFSTFLITNMSFWVWTTVPFFNLIQFPWRFLMYASLFVSIIAGGIFSVLPKIINVRIREYFTVSVLVIVCYMLLFPIKINSLKTKFFNPQGEYKLSSTQISNQNHLRYDASKISDEFMPKNLERPKNQSQSSTDATQCNVYCALKNIQFTPDRYKFEVSVIESGYVYIEKTYYPNFEVTIDGNKSKVHIGVNSNLGVLVPKGEHTVEFLLKNTLIRNLSNTITVVTLVVLVCLYYKKINLWKKTH